MRIDVSAPTTSFAVDPAALRVSPTAFEFISTNVFASIGTLTRATLDADLQSALDDMPDAFRQAVWLRDVEEFTYAEIAAMIGVPIGTVMSRISRGRRMLFDRLSKMRAGAA